MLWGIITRTTDNKYPHVRFCHYERLWGLAYQWQVMVSYPFSDRQENRILFDILIELRHRPTRLFICLFALFVFLALQPIVVVFSQPSNGLYPPHFRGFLITHNDAPQSVGLLWMSDQSIAETSTWQHITITTDKHPCPRWDSNPQSQKASRRRPTP